jgi:hypothetical protein
VLPPNFRDVTAEKVGTVVAIVGDSGAAEGQAEIGPRTGRASVAQALFRRGGIQVLAVEKYHTEVGDTFLE